VRVDGQLIVNPVLTELAYCAMIRGPFSIYCASTILQILAILAATPRGDLAGKLLKSLHFDSG
jgi:hypothetical protein